MRPSYGEFDWPDNHSRTQFLRGEFMDAVAITANFVLTELSKEPLSLFRSLVSKERILSWAELNKRNGPRCVRFIHAIETWSVSSNLNADWVREAAHYTFQGFQGSPDELTEFAPQAFYPKHDVQMTLPPPEGFAEYWPLMEDREDYLTHVHDQIAQRILNDPVLRMGQVSSRIRYIDTIITKLKESYCKKVEAALERQGLVRSNQKRRNLQEHLSWAVRFQLYEEGWSEIASGQFASTAIKSAVESLLNLIDLPIREIPKGRPQGRKDSRSAKIMRNLGRN